MKWIILLIMLFQILIVSAATEKVTFTSLSSYTIDDKNVTLIKINDKNDVALFCVNGVKNIVAEDEYRTINQVFIEVTSLKDSSVTTKLTYDCDECACGEECDNSVCFDEEEIEEFEDIIEEEVEVEDIIEDRGIVVADGGSEEIIEPAQINNYSIIIAALIIIVLLLGVIVFWQRTRF